MDLLNELRSLVDSLEGAGLPYALCGGLAVAVHGWTRATVDIDLLVPAESFAPIRDVAKGLGFFHEASPMDFAQGRVQMKRLVKIDPESGDPLLLDLILVTSALEETWAQRVSVEWEYGLLRVVSPEGLIRMKQLRDSLQDRADIEALQRVAESNRADGEQNGG